MPQLKLKNYKDNSLKSLKSFIISWNNKYPVDRIWRLKRNISFGSSEHREMCLIDMKIEIEEENMFKKYFQDIEDFESGKKEYEKTGEWLKMSEIKEEEKMERFDNIDLNAFDDNIKFD